MKQSLQNKLPVLHKTLSFKEFMAIEKQGDTFIAYCESDKDKSSRNDLKTSVKTGRDTCILIGPEGDFSPDEISLALQNKFIPVSLGATRLRTETAGIVAVHTVNLLNDNL
jgi:16S rRNA (uracil1498-N3)-methyltransferase